jgi:hypothetical protein
MSRGEGRAQARTEAEQAYDLIAMSRKSYLTYLWNEEGKENE